MRAESPLLSKKSSDERFGVKLFGVVILVTLVVAVALTTNGSQASGADFGKKMMVGSTRARHSDIEAAFFASTGVRARVATVADLARAGVAVRTDEVGSDDFGAYGLKFADANRYLSGHNGAGQKLTSENGINGNDDRWKVGYTNGVFKIINVEDSSQCAVVQSDGDVRLKSCDGSNARMTLLRMDTNTVPTADYNSATFALYGYEKGERFIKCTSSGSVYSGDRSDTEAFFSFVSSPAEAFSVSAAEAEASRVAGRKLKLVDGEFLARVTGRARVKKVAKDTYTTTFGGTYTIKSTASNRYLSSSNGKDSKLVTENTAGTDEKWDIQCNGDVPKFRFLVDGRTDRCIKMNSDGDVKLNNGCGKDNAKMLLFRVDGNTAPLDNYDDNAFMLYATEKQKFIVVDSSGNVFSSNDGSSTGYGYFSFASV